MSGRTRSRASGARIEVESTTEEGIVTSTIVEPDLPILAGHYPGFPIFPGVGLIDCVHQSALEAARLSGRQIRLEAVDSTRFLSPVFPGDRIETHVRVAMVDGNWRCSAVLSTDRGAAAEVRLRYSLGVSA